MLRIQLARADPPTVRLLWLVLHLWFLFNPSMAMTNGHEFEQVLGVGDGQGSLVCCSPWGRKESDTTERLNWISHYARAKVLAGESDESSLGCTARYFDSVPPDGLPWGRGTF